MPALPRILAVVVFAFIIVPALAVEPSNARVRWLPASPEKLPRWRGFNLLEKFNAGSGRKPFLEEDFRLIAKLGFNFVRLPMDYRCWIRDGNWEEFDESALKEIDQAVSWGAKYGIHVCLNFHRAPGYTVAQPPERTDLWTDPQTQRVCVLHWATFARRYRGIPAARLSFNLMNEPGRVDPRAYVAVVRKLAEAIHAEDPQRLIIADGLEWGSVPIIALHRFGVAEATRGYAPMEISHYRASWVNGDRFPYPQWPRVLPPNGTLLGPEKPEGSFPLVIDGPFSAATELRLRVLTVSNMARLVVEADGRSILQKRFQCGPGPGEWKKAVYQPQWQIYQNFYDRDYTATIPAGTARFVSAWWRVIGWRSVDWGFGPSIVVRALAEIRGRRLKPELQAQPALRAPRRKPCWNARRVLASGRPLSTMPLRRRAARSSAWRFRTRSGYGRRASSPGKRRRPTASA